MKYNNLLVLLSIGALTSSILAENISDSSRLEATSKTTLAIHPLFVSQSPEMVSGFRNDRNQTRENGRGGAFQAVLFGSRTTNSDDLARYFFPDGQDSLIAAEDSPEPAPGFLVKKNLLAQDFNVFTVDGNFESTITIAPKQSVIGLGLHYRQSFWKNHDRGRGFWLSASAPIMHVKNDMNFCEHIISNGGGADEAANDVVVANMTEAFQQKAWNFGKIVADSSMKKTGLGDIEFKIGYEWLQHEPAHMESYIGLVIPTGNKNKGEYVFEPIIGRGKYFGVMFGSCLGLEIWTSEAGDKNIRYELANHTEILFKREQIRSFDLKNKPWSRYLPVYLNQEQATEAQALARPISTNVNTPGINVFTQEVKVTPGLTHDINTAFIFTVRKLQAEVGYNFLAKRGEKVELNCCWQEGPALKHFLGDGTTNPIRTITGNQYLEQRVTTQFTAAQLIPVQLINYTNSLILESDLDLNSAATPALFANTLYGTLGFHCQEREYPLFGNFGGSYTFSQNNNAVPRRWVIWAKIGVSF